jgi:predicted TIM-barrel fold metal-dependent hydrolase
MEIIDVHTHILPDELVVQRDACCARDPHFARLYANPRARLARAEELLAAMDEAGVTRAVTFGFGFADLGLCAQCNAYVLDAARRHPGRLIPLAVTNPAAGAPAIALAERALADGAAGIGELMPAGQGYRLDDDAVLAPLMALAHEADVPVMLHVNEQLGHDYPGKADQGPSEALALARRYPQVRLVLAHLGGGLPFYELMPEVRAALANVTYDTAASPLLYEDAALRHIAAWAPDKLLWGSDYPLLSQTRFLQRVRRLKLDPTLATRLLHGNAYRVFKLPACADKEA